MKTSSEEMIRGGGGSSTPVSRRNIMRGVAASAFLPAVPHGSRRKRQDPTIDVAIVGGGVAGCYAAWRLASAPNPTGKIRLFERSERIGGRLFSVPCTGMKHPDG